MASRRHLRVLVSADQVRVVDQGSGNGTRINDQKVRDAVLQEGDRVEVGSSTFVYSRSPSVSVKPGRGRGAQPWMDVQTLQEGSGEELRRQFLEESLRAETRAMDPQAPPRSTTASPDVATARVARGRGTVSVGMSRSTVIIILLIALGIMLVVLSITVALLLTRADGASEPDALHQKMVEAAVAAELEGDSARADAVLQVLQREDKAAFQQASSKVGALRGRVRKVDAPKATHPPNAEAQPARKEAEAAKAEQARKDEEAPKAEEARKDEEARKAEEARKDEEARQLEEARKAEELRKAQEARPTRQARSRRPSRRRGTTRSAPRKLTNDQAMDMLRKASLLARDDNYKEAVRLLQDILSRAENGTARRKAEVALPRYRARMEGG